MRQDRSGNVRDPRVREAEQVNPWYPLASQPSLSEDPLSPGKSLCFKKPSVKPDR